jgi:uncharacterized membrane-anchored protein YhcB (DUF1043 family)
MVSTYRYLGVGVLAGFFIGCVVAGAIACAITLVIDNKLQKAQETNSSQKQQLEGLKIENARNIAPSGKNQTTRDTNRENRAS